MTFMQTADEQITALKSQAAQQSQLINKLQSGGNVNNSGPKYTPFPNEQAENNVLDGGLGGKRVPSAGRRAAVSQTNKLSRQPSNQQPKPEWQGVMDTNEDEHVESAATRQQQQHQQQQQAKQEDPSKAAKLAYLKKKSAQPQQQQRVEEPVEEVQRPAPQTQSRVQKTSAPSRKPALPSKQPPEQPVSNYVSDSPPLPAKQPTRAPSPVRMNEYDDAGDEEFMQGVNPDEYTVDEPLDTCPHCERSMRKSALRTHIAKKVCQKQRKTFDMRKQRVEGVLTQEDIRQLARKEQQEKKNAAKETSKPKKDWKAQHHEFQQAMKSAKNGVAPPPSDPIYDTRVPCPHCSRKFDESVAQRHIPHCKNTKNKPAPPPAQRPGQAPHQAATMTRRK